MDEIQVFQTPLFSKIKKKLKKNQIKDLDNAVREIIKNPELGEQKKGLNRLNDAKVT
jgi:type I restriction-modification system DNA methylase subunit